MTTTSDIIGKRLYDAGCRHAFGIPGGEVLSLMEGLENAGIDFHLVKHENAGGFMAEGTYHATGAPGILVATVGPGVVNAVNVVANAWQDQVPMIFLTGCVDAAEAETYTHQVFDHTDVIRPISKASMTVADGAVDVMIDKALAIAMQDPPGPVHLDVPINIAGKDAKVTGYPGRAAMSKVAPAAGPAHDVRLRLERALLDAPARPAEADRLDRAPAQIRMCQMANSVDTQPGQPSVDLLGRGIAFRHFSRRVCDGVYAHPYIVRRGR